MYIIIIVMYPAGTIASLLDDDLFLWRFSMQSLRKVRVSADLVQLSVRRTTWGTPPIRARLMTQ